MEYLAEFDDELIDTHNLFSQSNSTFGRIFLTMTNMRALRALKSYWEDYKNGIKLKKGYAKFIDVFKQLNDIRFYSVADRIKRYRLRRKS